MGDLRTTRITRENPSKHTVAHSRARGTTGRARKSAASVVSPRLSALCALGGLVFVGSGAVGCAAGDARDAGAGWTNAMEDRRDRRPHRSALGDPKSDQGGPRIAAGDGSSLLVWRDRLGVADRIFAARLSEEGAILDRGGIEIASGAVAAPDVAWNGTSWLVVWEDTASARVRGTRVSASGTLLDPAPSTISSAAIVGSAPAVASDGVDFLVAFVQGPSGPRAGTSILAARVAADGRVLDPIAIDLTGRRSQRQPAVTFDGAHYLIVWSDDRSGSWDIRGTRLTRTGTVVDAGGIEISTGDGDKVAPQVALATDYALVVWRDGRIEDDTNHEGDVFGARVEAATGAVLDPDGIAIATGANAHALAVAGGSDAFAVVWVSTAEAAPGDGASRAVAARVAKSTGAVLDAPVVLASGVTRASGGAAVAAVGDGFTETFVCRATPTQGRICGMSTDDDLNIVAPLKALGDM